MSTATIQANILYGLGEGANVTNTSYLAYALRWANAAYSELYLRYRFKHLRTMTIFRTTDGQATYQAPSDFMGFGIVKDESNSAPLGQITPEEFQRDVSTTQVTNESVTSSFDTAVSLANQGLTQYSETVTTTDGATTYARDTDYTMNYPTGAITVLSTGSMADATAYYIDYLYSAQNKPTKLCIEFDETNGRYVFRLDPVPDATYIFSLLYLASASALSDSVGPVWTQLEFVLERGGIYYGSLELIIDPQLRLEHKQNYENAMQALIQLDQDLIPKHDRIKTVLRKTDYGADTA